MASPQERPFTSCAPLLAASMIPGPPPVMIANPLRAICCATSTAKLIIDRFRGKAGRSKNGDRGTNIGHRFKAIHKFRNNAEHSPRIMREHDAYLLSGSP